MKIRTMQVLTVLLPCVTVLAITATIGYEYYRRNRLMREFGAAERELAQEERRLIGQSSGSLIVYTCAMHPEVRAKGPGECPKCGMSLSPLKVVEAKPPASKEKVNRQ